MPWSSYKLIRVHVHSCTGRYWILWVLLKNHLRVSVQWISMWMNAVATVRFLRWLKQCMSRNKVKKLQRKCGYCYRKACRNEQEGVDPCDICKLRDWLRNYHLADSNAFSLFNEFLEMGKSEVWLKVACSSSVHRRRVNMASQTQVLHVWLNTFWCSFCLIFFLCQM